jgi:hypothetical protein
MSGAVYTRHRTAWQRIDACQNPCSCGQYIAPHENGEQVRKNPALQNSKAVGIPYFVKGNLRLKSKHAVVLTVFLCSLCAKDSLVSAHPLQRTFATQENFRSFLTSLPKHGQIQFARIAIHQPPGTDRWETNSVYFKGAWDSSAYYFEERTTDDLDQPPSRAFGKDRSIWWDYVDHSLRVCDTTYGPVEQTLKISVVIAEHDLLAPVNLGIARLIRSSVTWDGNEFTAEADDSVFKNAIGTNYFPVKLRGRFQVDAMDRPLGLEVVREGRRRPLTFVYQYDDAEQELQGFPKLIRQVFHDEKGVFQGSFEFKIHSHPMTG